MSHFVVPNWNLRHQRQEQVGGGGSEDGNTSSSHVNTSISHLVPMSGYEVAELTWENGQLAMNGLSGLLPSAPTKPTWAGRSSDTLESIIHQATKQQPQPPTANMSTAGASSAGNWEESSSRLPMAPTTFLKKRTRPDHNSDDQYCCKSFTNGYIFEEDHVGDRSACGSASAATMCRGNDTTMMTCASPESPRSLKTAKTTDEDSACHGGSVKQHSEDRETKSETARSHATRRSRAAAIHNLSERKRRDRINQKMKTLQRLVPNANKTDKASMLDEVIEYLKQLQAQVQMMSSMRNIPQMMMPLGMQQHLQMSLLSRLGMGAVGLGLGMGMMDINAAMARNAAITPHSLSQILHHPSQIPPPFLLPPMIPARATPPQPIVPEHSTNGSVPLPDPYCAFLAQSMNMDLYRKMAALHRPQQVNQTTQTARSSSPSQTIIGED